MKLKRKLHVHVALTVKLQPGMSKIRIGQPQHNQPVKNDHNYNLTKLHTPMTSSTKYFCNKTPQPQPQPIFFRKNTITQPQHKFSLKITPICGSTTILPQNLGHY